MKVNNYNKQQAYIQSINRQSLKVLSIKKLKLLSV